MEKNQVRKVCGYVKKFLKGVRGKQILVSGLAVLVLVAGYYRWSVDRIGDTVTVMNEELPSGEMKSETVKNIEVSEDNYFAKARYERDCARSEATELLKVSSQHDNENGDAIAATKIAEYAKNIEAETAIENLVIAKGYADCVAFVDETGVRVVVKSDKLEKDGVTKIKDIVIEQTGAKATEIKISGKN